MHAPCLPCPLVTFPSQALALEATHDNRPDSAAGGLGSLEDAGSSNHLHTDASNGGGSEVMSFYEITVASVDQPKLLSRLSEALVGELCCTSLAAGNVSACS